MKLKAKVWHYVKGDFEVVPESLGDWVRHVATVRKIINEWIDEHHEYISPLLSRTEDTSLRTVVVDLLQQFDGKLIELRRRAREKQDQDRRISDLLGERDSLRQEIHDLHQTLRIQADDNKQDMMKRESIHHRMLEEVTNQHAYEMNNQVQKHKHSEQNMIEQHERDQRSLTSQFDATITDKDKTYNAEVRRLKNALVSSSETEVPLLTDTMLKEQVEDLANLVTSLARPPFWSGTPDLTRLTHLLDLPDSVASSLTGKNRKLLLESAIWSILMERFFTTPLGMGSVGVVGNELVEMWCQLFPNNGMFLN